MHSLCCPPSHLRLSVCLCVCVFVSRSDTNAGVRLNPLGFYYSTAALACSNIGCLRLAAPAGNRTLNLRFAGPAVRSPCRSIIYCLS